MANSSHFGFSSIGLILRGAAMGIAEVIPGVSGGTIGLITGIYLRLVQAIKGITSILIEPSLLLRPKDLWNRVDGNFLMYIIGGMFIGIVIGLFGVTYLLENFPEPLWAFFFGLILASILYLLRINRPFDIKNMLGIIIGALIAFGLVMIVPAQGNASLPIIFGAGMIAICALILPGISGSFMLLLMGLYSVVIPAVKDVISLQDLSKFPIVLTFGLGCLLGISLFSRVLNWLLDQHYKPTMSVLIGFMIGSLYKLWPWRNPVVIMNKDSHEVLSWDQSLFNAEQLLDLRVLVEHNVFPGQYWGTPYFIPVIFSFLAGLIVVLGLAQFSAKK